MGALAGMLRFCSFFDLGRGGHHVSRPLDAWPVRSPAGEFLGWAGVCGGPRLVIIRHGVKRGCRGTCRVAEAVFMRQMKATDAEGGGGAFIRLLPFFFVS